MRTKSWEDERKVSLQTIFVTNERWLIILAVVGLCLIVGLIGGAYIAFLTPLLAALVLIALVGGLLMLRNIQWGLFALVGIIYLLPFAALPVNIGFSPTFLDLVLVVIFFVWLTTLVTRKQEEFLTSPLAVPILVFILLAFASFVAGLAHARLSANVLRHFVEIIMCIALFFVIVNCVRTPKHLERVVTLLILAGFVAALIGVVLNLLPEAWTIRLLSVLGRVRYPTGWGVLRFIEDDPTLSRRATSTSVDPNVLGGMLIFVGALTASQLFVQKPLLRRIFVAPMLAVMALCLYMTYSRSSLLGLVTALLLLGAARYRRLLLVLLIMGVIALLIPQTQVGIQRLQEGLRWEDRASRMRLGEYKDALILISRYPWLGVGFAGTPDIDIYIGVSNVYLLIAEQMGLVGLFVFLVIMAVFFVYSGRAWWKMRKGTRLESILLGLVAALAGVMVAGVLDHYLFNLNFPHAVALFWLYVGLAMAATMAKGEGTGDTPAPP
ncbi:MAG: O-antigen ligase family protein [Anaerolineae bacterium]|nr:O-antigen ligase family protein [Anaerolineae bacterium]